MTKTKHLKPILVAVVSLIFVLTSLQTATAEKIATVDINKILNEIDDAKAERKELDELSLKAKKDIKARKEKLEKLEKSLKSKGVARDSEEANKFRGQIRDFERFVRDTEENLKRRYVKINKTLATAALAAVKKYAQKNDLALVLDKSQEVRGPVLFRADSYDITSKVIASMK